MRVDSIFLGEQLTDLYKVKPGMKVLWLLDRTSRARHPYIGGDVLEAEILCYPWSNGKVMIRSTVGFKATIRVGALYEDKRKAKFVGCTHDGTTGAEVCEEGGARNGGSSEPGNDLRGVKVKGMPGVPNLTAGSRGLDGPDSKT